MAMHVDLIYSVLIFDLLYLKYELDKLEKLADH